MRLLLLTPPFTQLNTPYPATAYLQGFLKSVGIKSHQADLGIEVILRLFSREGLRRVFEIASTSADLGPTSARTLALAPMYLRTIDTVIQFLQHRNPTVAHVIADRSLLPESGRFAQLEDLEWAFGTMGIQDQARHIATLYLEDLGDLITEAVDPHFGFSRYAERLGSTATHFQPLAEALSGEPSLVTETLWQVLAEKVEVYKPTLVGLSIPFPGNLYGGLRCGQWLKQQFPSLPVVLGGGFANTELRRLEDPRLFDYVDYVCLDDGEAPLLQLISHLEGSCSRSELKRCYLREEGKVVYVNGAKEKDIPQREVGTPDYADLPLDRYLSVVELANPMHRLWSDGRWNKLTLAHGCYWGKCSFCDISLDYIQRYEPVTASLLCDRIEAIVEQTGENGFHFVDEAAPPALMRDLAIEILRRGLTIAWWTNIRFEKRFTTDLCRLLKASGCIAVSGGLEVASDRLLDKMKKGVTVAQVARVAQAFTEAGIMVHAYLMYGFPTQTAQETIDSLEMVRQLFSLGLVQSGYWHRFAMTAHSPVGLDPAAYGVLETGPEFWGFADNDRHHDDPKGADHDQFAEGLRKSLFNYMQGVGLDLPLSKWFLHRVPKPSVPSDYLAAAVTEPPVAPPGNAMVLWLGPEPLLKDLGDGTAELEVVDRRESYLLDMSLEAALWLRGILLRAVPGYELSLDELRVAHEQAGPADFPSWEAFWADEMIVGMREAGLLLVV